MGRGTRNSTPATVASASNEELRRSLRAGGGAPTPSWVTGEEAPALNARPVTVDDLDPRGFPPGTRIELVALQDEGPDKYDDTANLPPGTRGTVSERFDPDTFGGFAKQLPVDWDNGSRLMAAGGDRIVRLGIVMGAKTRPLAPAVIDADLIAAAEQAGEDPVAFKVRVLTEHPGPIELTYRTDPRPGPLGGTPGPERRSVRASKVELGTDGTLAVTLDFRTQTATMLLDPESIVEAREVL